MKTPLKIALITGGLVVLLIIAVLVIVQLDRASVSASSVPDGPLPATRADTHVLDSVGPDAPTLVEFLDFECEVCGAFYPYIEEIRAEYDGQINYAFRYFPIPGHANSMNAALAVEAAAQQDRTEDMFHQMFQTQAQWGEHADSKADLFRGFAQELGLDMTAYDRVIADPATRARIQSDFDDARAMGVSGTPTFYLDGERLDLSSLTDLTDAIEASLLR